MSPAEIEYRLARSLDDYKTRRTHGETPDPEEYLDELGEAAYPEFLAMVELEQMLDAVLDPGPEEDLPREFGPYLLIREIGRGAMGMVFEAMHLSLQRRVAVKILLPSARRSELDVEQFIHEARSLARIEHNNIVQVYDVGSDGEVYYLVMQILRCTWIRDLRCCRCCCCCCTSGAEEPRITAVASSVKDT